MKCFFWQFSHTNHCCTIRRGTGSTEWLCTHPLLACWGPSKWVYILCHTSTSSQGSTWIFILLTIHCMPCQHQFPTLISKVVPKESNYTCYHQRSKSWSHNYRTSQFEVFVRPIPQLRLIFLGERLSFYRWSQYWFPRFDLSYSNYFV